MNAFSWFVLACVAVCAVLAVRAMRRLRGRLCRLPARLPPAG